VIFGDLTESEFADASDAVIADITKDKRKPALNPLVVAAFRESPIPCSMDDVLAIYAKLFASLESKVKPYLAACAAARPGPVQGFDPATGELIGTPFKIMPASEATTINLHGLYRTLNAGFVKAIPF